MDVIRFSDCLKLFIKTLYSCVIMLHNASRLIMERIFMSFDFASNEILLSIDDICKKLSISRSSLERMRRPDKLQNIIQSSGLSHLSQDEPSFYVPFPEPTIVLGRSPRWSATVLNAWLHKNSALSSSSLKGK